MRVLHVGWGFSPWRPGGLIAYAEDVMRLQAERGHEVAYFLSGRHYPYIGGPRLKRWRRHRVRHYEVINPPVIASVEAGTRNPDREISEPQIEAAFARVVGAERPDVVHVQELAGLPSSLLDVAEAAGVPTVMTLQDYFPLCTTIRLRDADGRLCTRRQVGADCVARNAQAPPTAAHLIRQTLQFEIARARRIFHIGPQVSFARLAPFVGAAFRQIGKSAVGSHSSEGDSSSVPDQAAISAAFQRRRDVNVERLSRVGKLIAQSERVAEIYAERGVTADRMITLPFTLRHIERLRPRRLDSPPSRLTFATLNGCASPTKGSELILDALRRLRDAGLEGRFRLLVFGWVDDAVLPELADFAGVELRGLYSSRELDSLLDDVDVGLMPSTWEEALGYVGLEMIAKGIPLIANPLGGIVSYAIDGETAWLNRSCSGHELAQIMAKLVVEPDRVVELHRRLLRVRGSHIVPMESHADALEAVYSELIRG